MIIDFYITYLRKGEKKFSIYNDNEIQYNLFQRKDV